MFSFGFGLLFLLVASSFGKITEDDTVFVNEQEAVQSGVAKLPCNIAPTIEDKVYLVIWYKEGVTKPIYTFDARFNPLDQAKHWADDSLGGRASFHYNEDPAKLKIENVKDSDSGVFKCRVDFQKSPTRNYLVNLTVIIPPEKLSILDAQGSHIPHYILGPYNEGASIDITCVATGGRPTPRVTWWQENALLDDSFEVLPERRVRNVLRLEKLQRKHLHTVFTCQASNNNLIAPISSAVTLEMNLRPLLIRLKGENKPLSAENSYELGCEVWGSRPTPTITWWKGSVAMRNTREMTDPDGNKTTSILTFVPTIDDGGKYLSCRGEQSLIPDSGIEDGWKLDIYHVPVVTLELGSNLNGSTIREGVDVYFECNIKSNPWVYKVSWRHNGKILYNNIEQGTIVSNQSLVLQGVTRARAGLYTCVGSNHEGDGESNPVHLDVKFAPVCRPGQPKVYGVARQETARITCELEANPQDLQFTWKFNNTADTIDIPQSLIAMDRTRSQAAYTPMTELDYGTLMCWGKNEIGMQKEPCVYYINPAGKPDALQNCTLLNQTFDSLQVECLEGFNGGLTQEFVMEVYDITQNRKLVTNVTSRTPYFAVGGLESGLSFDIVLFATNKKGRSDFTVLQAFTLQSAEKHTASTPVFLKITPILGALIGVITALLMVTIVIVCIIRMRRRDNRDDKDADENGLSHDRRSINTSGDKASTEPLNKELGDSMDSFEEKNPDIIPQGNGEDDYQDEEKAFERLNNASTRVYSRLQSPNNIGRSSPYDSSFNIGKTNDEITYAELSLSNKQLPSLPHVVYSNHQSIPMTLIRRNEPTVYAQIDMSAKAQSMQNPSRFPLHPQLSMSTQTHPSMHQRGGIPVLPTTTIQTLSPPLQNSLLQHRSTNLHPAYLTTPRQHHQQHTPAHQHHTTADDSMHITAETPLINPRESTVPTLQPLLEANASRSLNNQQPRSITATRF